MCVCCSRLLCGRTWCARWVCLSTSHWTPSTGSRPDAPTAALRWASSLTTAATPSPPVSFCPVWVCLSENVEAQLTIWVLLVCSVCGAGNQYSSADGHQPGLDVLLLLRRHVYVLLCPLANVCVRNAALWDVSHWNLFCLILAKICFISDFKAVLTDASLLKQRFTHWKRADSRC